MKRIGAIDAVAFAGVRAMQIENPFGPDREAGMMAVRGDR
jgi:hypothetical protein